MNILRKVFCIVNNIISRGYWYNEVKFKDCKKFWTYKTFNTVVVNLGSTSGVCAFSYTEIPLKCANWALSANPLLGDFSILKNYFGYLQERGATVILPLCPFSSLAGRYSITEDRYYSLLYPSTIPNFSFRRQQQVKAEMRYPFLSYPLIAVLSDFKKIVWKRKMKILSDQQMSNDAEQRMKNWMKEFGIIDFSYPLSLINKDSIEEAAKILNEMIAFCKERSIRIVLLIPPVYNALGKLFTTEIRSVIIDSLIDKIEDKEVWFHNYMDDEYFCQNKSLFQNSFLLNEEGAKSFTKRVISDIRLHVN